MRARQPVLAETEKEYQAKIVQWAKLRGWDVYHTLHSLGSEPGFPDLTMVRAPELIFAEIKREKGKLTERQAHWIEELTKCGVRVYVWRPSDFDQAVEVLS